MKIISTICFFFAALIIVTGVRAFAETPSFQPISLGDGPILLFKQPKKDRKELALYLFDPSIHENPQLLWQNDYHPNPTPLRRLSSELLLFEFEKRLLLLDIPKGSITALLPEIKGAQELLLVDDKDIFFLRKSLDTSIGYQLETGSNNKTLVKEYPKARYLLYKFSLETNLEALQLSPVHIEKVLQPLEDGFLVITADNPRSLAVIGRDGSIEKIGPFDPSWVAVATTHSVSPEQNYLALGILTLQQDFHEERTLIVYELEKNLILFEDIDIPLGANLFSGRSMYLDLYWEDEKVLGYGGPFAFSDSRFVDLEKAERVEAPPLQKHMPKLQDRLIEKRGQFDLAFGEIYFSGDSLPIGSVLNEEGSSVRDLALDAAGNWAAYCGLDNVIYLINGQKKEKKTLQVGWAHDLMWLDAKSPKSPLLSDTKPNSTPLPPERR